MMKPTRRPRHTFHTGAAATVAGAALTLASCGGSGAPTAPSSSATTETVAAPGPAPCDVLTATRARVVIGPGRLTVTREPTQCAYSHGLRAVQISLAATTAAGRSIAQHPPAGATPLREEGLAGYTFSKVQGFTVLVKGDLTATVTATDHNRTPARLEALAARMATAVAASL
jgi:hypothetical protein